MIVVTNKYIPGLKPKSIKKDQKPIADTDAGDLAYYTTDISGGAIWDGSSDDSDDDVDGDSDDEKNPLLKIMKRKLKLSPPAKKKRKKLPLDSLELNPVVKSLSGADWRPIFNDRMSMFIAGAPGAGKSYLAKQMINLLPSNYDILLFTALDEKDGNFDDLGKDRLYKIKMVPDVLSKITLAEIRKRTKGSQTILLFDDVDKIRDPKIQNLVFSIMNDALANGRGHEKHDGNGDIHIICTSHSLNDYQKTKYTFENSNYVAMFPGATPVMQMYRICEKMGIPKELCQKLIRLGRAQKFRSVIVHKVVPMYIIFGNKIMLL